MTSSPRGPVPAEIQIWQDMQLEIVTAQFGTRRRAYSGPRDHLRGPSLYTIAFGAEDERYSLRCMPSFCLIVHNSELAGGLRVGTIAPVIGRMSLKLKMHSLFRGKFPAGCFLMEYTLIS